MDNAVKMKQKAQKHWKSGDPKEGYLKAWRATKAAVYFAKKDVQAGQFANVNNYSVRIKFSK